LLLNFDEDSLFLKLIFRRLSPHDRLHFDLHEHPRFANLETPDLVFDQISLSLDAFCDDAILLSALRLLALVTLRFRRAVKEFPICREALFAFLFLSFSHILFPVLFLRVGPFKGQICWLFKG